MKTSFSRLTRLAAFLLVVVMMIPLVACVKAEPAGITIEGAETPTIITKDSSVTLKVTVTGLDDPSYSWSVSDPTVLKVENDVVTVIADVTASQIVTVTATANADKTLKATKSFVVNPAAPGEPEVSIVIDGANEATQITKGDDVFLAVTVTGAEDTTYTWTLDPPDILSVQNDHFFVSGTVTESTVVTATATANADSTKTAVKTFLVQPAPVSNVTVKIADAASTIRKGETIQLNVTVEGALQDSSYTWVISDPTLLAVDENGVVTVLKDVILADYVTITAVSVEDPTAKASKTIHVERTPTSGTVGELTSGMLTAIGNPSITVTGTLTDYYRNVVTEENIANEYEMTVLMEDGRWSGSWNLKGNREVITNIYRRGDILVTNANGVTGYDMEELLISMNNTVLSKPVKDYMSIAAEWNSQHLYNHLGNLDISKFVYDADSGAYKYQIDVNDEDTLYLMTYLAFSLTPMLSDTLMELYLLVDGNQITGLVAKTEVLYYGASDDSGTDATALSWTELVVSFSDVGSTTVPDPTPYSIPEGEEAFFELLANALQEMRDAESYTYVTKDVTTNAPSYDSGDYTLESVPSSSVTVQSNTPIRTAAFGESTTTATGTVGDIGYVTPDALLIGKTIEYAYSLDGNNFNTSWSGYRQFEGYYELFSYDKEAHEIKDTNGEVISYLGAFAGTKRVDGSFAADILPKFNFAPEIFEYSGYTKSDAGTKLYRFELQATAVTRDVAMALSCYGYASNADASISTVLTLVVDENGHLVSSVFPYSIVSGTYMGYCTTTYSKINATTIPEGAFDNYVPREVKTNWSQYLTKYYYPDHISKNWTTEQSTVPADVVFRAIFQDSYDALPAPSVLMETFGDNIYGPFFDWKTVTDENGNEIYKDYVTITTVSGEYDENMKITNYEEIITEVKENLEALGFRYVAEESNPDRTAIQGGSRYVCFVKGDITIVIENNFTRYFWIYFYQTGTWTNSYTH